jgi:putative transposase
VLACDFFVAVTATFRVVDVFVVLEVGTRRIVHWNVTAHPTADWTGQQFRMIVSGDHPHRYTIHDRDRIYSEGVDRSLAAMGLTVLRTPVRAPQANAFCERLVGTIRREMLGFRDSSQRAASPTDSSTMGRALQSRPPTQQLGTGASGSSA